MHTLALCSRGWKKKTKWYNHLCEVSFVKVNPKIMKASSYQKAKPLVIKCHYFSSQITLACCVRMSDLSILSFSYDIIWEISRQQTVIMHAADLKYLACDPVSLSKLFIVSSRGSIPLLSMTGWDHVGWLPRIYVAMIDDKNPVLFNTGIDAVNGIFNDHNNTIEFCMQHKKLSAGQIIKALNMLNELFHYSTTICKLVDLIPALHQSDCRIPNWVSAKTVLSSSTNHSQTTARFRSFSR